MIQRNEKTSKNRQLQQNESDRQLNSNSRDNQFNFNIFVIFTDQPGNAWKNKKSGDTLGDHEFALFYKKILI